MGASFFLIHETTPTITKTKKHYFFVSSPFENNDNEIWFHATVSLATFPCHCHVLPLFSKGSRDLIERPKNRRSNDVMCSKREEYHLYPPPKKIVQKPRTIFARCLVFRRVSKKWFLRIDSGSYFMSRFCSFFKMCGDGKEMRAEY